jgi:hypothetical protein
MRLDKVVNGLNEFCVSKKLKGRLIVDKKRVTLRAAQPRLWETLIYPVPLTALWIWYFVDESKEVIGLLFLLGLSIYFIWTYFEIAKGLNEISINHETDEVEIINLDRIFRHLYKPVRFKIDVDNRVLKKRKRFNRLDNNFRIYAETKIGTLTLIDVEDDYTSDKFKFALNVLVTTKHGTQQCICVKRG